MTWSGLLVFCSAYVLAVASPGPGVAAIVARVLGRGLTGIWAFILGFVVGDLIWFILAVAGLAVIAKTFAAVFVAVKWAGAAYLLWLAWKMWTSRPVSVAEGAAPPADEPPGRLFLASLSLTLGNPKVIVFFMALLPSLVDLTTLGWLGILEIVALIAVVISSVLGAYALAAARARTLFRSSRALRLLNRATGTIMAGAAVAIVTK
jgi:threonine/homoserine/homoserine lactone efflux protein